MKKIILSLSFLGLMFACIAGGEVLAVDRIRLNSGVSEETSTIFGDAQFEDDHRVPAQVIKALQSIEKAVSLLNEQEVGALRQVAQEWLDLQMNSNTLPPEMMATEAIATETLPIEAREKRLVYQFVKAALAHHEWLGTQIREGEHPDPKNCKKKSFVIIQSAGVLGSSAIGLCTKNDWTRSLTLGCAAGILFASSNLLVQKIPFPETMNLFFKKAIQAGASASISFVGNYAYLFAIDQSIQTNEINIIVINSIVGFVSALVGTCGAHWILNQDIDWTIWVGVVAAFGVCMLQTTVPLLRTL
jgi:hypothetical protein